MAANARAAILALWSGFPFAETLPPWVVAVGLLYAVALLGLWWLRDRRMQGERSTMQMANQVAEEIAAATSALDILAKLNSALPKISDGLRASLFVYNRGSKRLSAVTATYSPSAASKMADAALDGVGIGVGLCFQNGTLINVPDTRRSPFFEGSEKKNLPKSCVFVPMLAQADLAGVLEISHQFRLGFFHEAEKTAFQHLANQAAIALRLQEQKSVRERLFQTERLAAAGQLISGIASELRSPLGSIIELTGSLKTRKGTLQKSEVDLIEAEALRASEIVSRLVAFGKRDRSEAQPVDIHGLLTRLARTRTPEPRCLFSAQRITVLGSQAQLEQVFLNLLVYAEQAAIEDPDRLIQISTSLLARRVLIEIGYGCEPAEVRKADPFENGGSEKGAMGLGFCRSMIQENGGDVRFVRGGAGQCRFEVELPVMESAQGRPGTSIEEARFVRRQLTALVVEPDTKTQKQIIQLLGKRGDRVVPVSSAEEAIDLAQRLRFDLTLCAVRLPGLNWVEFFERVRRHVGTFVLLTQGHDPDLNKAFHHGEGFVLSKPLDEKLLNGICDGVADRTAH